MTDLDREQLKRECADALEALSRDQRTDRVAELAESLRTLGPPYQFHGELMHGALRDGQEERDHLAPDSRAREARETRRRWPVRDYTQGR